MLKYSLDTDNAILYLHPDDELEAENFAQLARVVNPYIEQNGSLAGVIVDAPGFPGWDDFSAFISHIRFVKNHHQHVKKIALVTDSALGNIAEHLVAHFVAAEIKHFPAGQSDQAKNWIMGDISR